jgi:hypothetical protein
VYDAEGRLLLAIAGTKTLWGGDKSTVRLCDMIWQPYLATTSAAVGPIITRNSDAVGIIRSLCLSKRAQTPSTYDSGRVLIRVLECVESEEDGANQLCRSLAGLKGMEEAGVVVEVYSATHHQDLLNGLTMSGTGLPREVNRWLRPRRALLPAALTDLKGFAFDVVVMNSHVSGVQEAWGGAEALVGHLRRLACPGALVLFNNCTTRTTGGDDAASLREALQPFADGGIWEAGASPTTTATTTTTSRMAVARLTDVGHVEARGSKTLVVTDDSSRASTQAFASRLGGPSSVGVLLCGPGQVLHDEASDGTWVKALRPHIKPGEGVDTIVFLAGMRDHSPLSSVGFYRLLSLLKAIAALNDTSSNTPAAQLDLWVVTQGCYASQQVHIGQASLYAVTRHLEAEVVGVSARYVDVESPACLPRLASLIASRPAERNYRLLDIDGDTRQQQQAVVPLVQRYFAHESTELNWRDVSAHDSNLTYHAKLYKVEEGPVPGQVSGAF